MRGRDTSRSRAIGGGILIAMGLACGGPPAASSGDLDTDPTAGPAGPPPPVFAEPASGRLSLRTTRDRDIELVVSGVTVGRTELRLDDHGFGTLDAESLVGRLTADTLRLYVRGAMVPGQHRMQLQTINSAGQSASDEILIEITGEPSSPPIASPPQATAVPGQSLWYSGQGPDPVLIVFEGTHEEGPRVHLVAPSPTGWDFAQARTLPTPGLIPAADSRALPVTAWREGSEPDDLIRVAWRVGNPGTRIDMVQAPWSAVGPGLLPHASLTVEQLQGQREAEWAELGRPWWLQRRLVVEVWAPVDVESPRPGDRALMWAQWHDGAFDPPQRLSVEADLVDLDRLGPVVTRLGPDDPSRLPAVSVRADQIEALVVEVDPQGGLRVRSTQLDGRDRSFSFVDIPLASIIGAFGSRTVAGLTARAGARMRVAWLDDLGDGGVTTTSLNNDDLPDFDGVTGEIAPGVLAGHSLFLVPYGPDIAVQAIYPTANAIESTPIPSLQCDSVALGPSVADSPPQLAVACTRDGQVWISTLEFDPE